MNFKHGRQFPPHSFRFNSASGGGGAPVIAAPPSPAATETSVEVIQAKQAAKQAAAARQGINSTIMTDALSTGVGALKSKTTGGNMMLGGG